jgi:glycosyltransferase involved in cell wall biosynthesis
MKILIVTGIYPPQVGGPAYYAKGLEEALGEAGHETKVVTYGALMRLPAGVRHAAFFVRLLPKLVWADRVIALDTFSVAWPLAWATRLVRVPFVLRTGGDFVWEEYLERTGEDILLKDFYIKERAYTIKEKLLLRATRYVLLRADKIIFSTVLQRDIWVAAYNIPESKTYIIENAIDAPLPSVPPQQKNFLWYVRPTAFKNSARLHAAFAKAKEQYPDIILEEGQIPKQQLLEKMASCYAVVLPSLTEISPNYILDALRFKKPFIMDKYSGLADKLGPYGMLVDPLDEADIVRGIEELASDDGYARAVAKVSAFNEVRSYSDVAQDFIKILIVI